MKGQVSMEFLAMVGFAGISIMLVLGASYDLFDSTIRDARYQTLLDFGQAIQEEIILASEVHPGYERTFRIPQTIDTMDYSISITNDVLYITQDGRDIPFTIPDVTGSITKGNVTVKNVNGNVEIT
jgi:hypothetical protein